MTSTAELRSQFLEFFRERGHEVVASSSLVPAQDPTLLFTNAGMVQFKDVFLGTEKRAYNRAVTAQRCVRAGGKHNDLENVGYTARHHTFFEMLGNFSFGDYFKEDAIRFAWDFLTGVLKLPKDKLWVTVYIDDDEAADIWLKQIGVPEERFTRIAGSDNFWQMGDTGPCGPCSEIFYDHGPEVAGGPPGTPEEDGDRYIEIWNLVFMQYDRSADGELTPLPKPCVDTGMGLERLAAVMQHVHSNYEIDLFQNLLSAVARIAGSEDLTNSSLRVIADHIRSCAFLITDGVLPSNDGRGYVLRRIIRRAARHGHSLGLSEPFFHKLVAPLVAEMGAAYPELSAAQAQVERVLRMEEERFNETLDQGLKILEDGLKGLSGTEIPGEMVFRLYDTYGFPYDLTADIARERGLTLDQAGFDRSMEEQRQRARAASQFGVDLSTRVTVDQPTEFLGYDRLAAQGRIVGLYTDGKSVETLGAGQPGLVVLDRTPFYAESGGQVGDQGVLQTASARFVVEDTQKQGVAFTHIGRLEQGELKIGDELEAQVDGVRRQATVLNHSATHLMHAALRRVLGDHVQQKGSLVGPDYLRFDFSHFEPVSAEQQRQVEDIVNAEIRANAAAEAREMAMEDAKKTGAMALFGEKYGDRVRVLSIGEFSVELCGGTHVSRAGDIGLFKIVSEAGIAAGVRRIEAITGAGALQWVDQRVDALQSAAHLVKANPEELPQRLQQLVDRARQLEKEVEALKAQRAGEAGDALLQQAVEIDGLKVLAARMDGLDNKALRDAMDRLRDKLGSAAVLLASVEDGKVRLVAGVSKDQTGRLKAGDLVNSVALRVGGKGGGRPDMAQAGGSDPTQLDAALADVTDWVRSQLGA